MFPGTFSDEVAQSDGINYSDIGIWKKHKCDTYNYCSTIANSRNPSNNFNANTSARTYWKNNQCGTHLAGINYYQHPEYIKPNRPDRTCNLKSYPSGMNPEPSRTSNISGITLRSLNNLDINKKYNSMTNPRGILVINPIDGTLMPNSNDRIAQYSENSTDNFSPNYSSNYIEYHQPNYLPNYNAPTVRSETILGEQGGIIVCPHHMYPCGSTCFSFAMGESCLDNKLVCQYDRESGINNCKGGKVICNQIDDFGYLNQCRIIE
jgi:hypothetical protein